MARPGDYIVTHNTDNLRYHPEDTYMRFLQRFHVKSGLGLLPSLDIKKGEATPHISYGRWCVLCEDCRGAVVAEPTEPVFCCPDCGSRGGWLDVNFPADRAAIEAVLLERPGFRNDAPFRNWNISETVDDLRAQNIERGDPVSEV